MCGTIRIKYFVTKNRKVLVYIVLLNESKKKEGWGRQKVPERV